ncbi:hypothetical protein [Mycobacteroides abscessus]|uniref:hypothetical protein n=1 Tax=Mycobacteroides abscessus TaxID=36809 RepID=UPI0009A8DCB9|nr:hypothetical protein [Mycobacteroides abscessus]SKP84821.1 Uncharacterised protein [Mycobacteroides abscessus subsp. massiliense]SLB74163.1 Uncharacterised protein [Mycobacteroides abscessus subsp. massiliense]
MGQLARDALDSFREGLRHKKIKRPLSDALVHHLGTGDAAGQYGDRIHELCAETLEIDVDVDKAGVYQARKFVIWTLRGRHPELTAEALRALGDYRAENWR